RRSLSYIAAYRIAGVLRLITRSIAPTPSFTYSTFFHVRPPSWVRNTPRSSFRENRWPMAATYTASGFVGGTTMRAMRSESRTPISCHVAPASVDLNTPLPEYEDRALA